MRMIERQLQTAVNSILQWCDTNGHSISASKSCCVHFCRKRGIHPDPEVRIRDIQIPVVPEFFSQVFGAAWPKFALAPLKLTIIITPRSSRRTIPRSNFRPPAHFLSASFTLAEEV
ncbi:putative RNA-directed DNA polymerase from transposon BS [Trichonephila clavipes]|nr:putative RNA-directed DNA polymerase from transposon BS [Trichonephila clavipes]